MVLDYCVLKIEARDSSCCSPRSMKDLIQKSEKDVVHYLLGMSMEITLTELSENRFSRHNILQSWNDEIR
jgi:hypothetical protein